jgi:amino acid transporter
MPFALFVAIAVVASLYLLIQIVCIGVLPQLAGSQRPLADAGSRFLGPAGAALISAGALVSMMGTLNSIMLAGPRILFAMAEGRQLPQFFAATHRRFHTPYASILFTAVVMLAISLAGTFLSALTISTVIRLITYVATCAAVPVLRRKMGMSTGYAIRGAPVVYVSALVLCGWLLSSAAWTEIRNVAIAVVFGWILSLFCRRGRHSASAAARSLKP